MLANVPRVFLAGFNVAVVAAVAEVLVDDIDVSAAIVDVVTAFLVESVAAVVVDEDDDIIRLFRSMTDELAIRNSLTDLLQVSAKRAARDAVVESLLSCACRNCCTSASSSRSCSCF